MTTCTTKDCLSRATWVITWCGSSFHHQRNACDNHLPESMRLGIADIRWWSFTVVNLGDTR